MANKSKVRQFEEIIELAKAQGLLNFKAGEFEGTFAPEAFLKANAPAPLSIDNDDEERAALRDKLKDVLAQDEADLFHSV